MAKKEKEKPSPKKTPKPIEALPTGIRKKIETVLLVGTIGAGAALAGGEGGKLGYRYWTGYDPDKTTEVAQPPKKENEVPEQKPPEDEDLWEKTKRKINEIKKRGKKEVNEKVNKLPIVKEYHETKRKALEMGDDIAYWLAFAFAFLVASALTYVNIKSARIKAMENKINEMIPVLNELRESGGADAKMPPELIKKLTGLADEFEGISGISKEDAS